MRERERWNTLKYYFTEFGPLIELHSKCHIAQNGLELVQY